MIPGLQYFFPHGQNIYWIPEIVEFQGDGCILCTNRSPTVFKNKKASILFEKYSSQKNSAFDYLPSTYLRKFPKFNQVYDALTWAWHGERYLDITGFLNALLLSQVHVQCKYSNAFYVILVWGIWTAGIKGYNTWNKGLYVLFLYTMLSFCQNICWICTQEPKLWYDLIGLCVFLEAFFQNDTLLIGR